jgi:Ca-activated chloride channel family protein
MPPLLALARWSARRRAGEWCVLGQGGRLPGDGAIAWSAAIACLIVSLAQPRWGRVPAPPLPPGRDVVLLVDDSLSMAAHDAVPDRLGVAVEAATSLVARLGREAGNRVAVVAFAGRGVLRCPLTENLSAVEDTLRSLRPGDVRPGGTDLAAGLNTALDALGSRGQQPEHAGGRTVVLFSDGEDHGGSADTMAQRAGAAGVVVHTVAIGDAEHDHPVPLPGGEGTLSYRGAPVRSRRTDTALAAIAEATGGALVPLGLAAADLGELYLQRIEPVARQKRLVFRPSERAERFGWFVLAALVLGLRGSWQGHHRREPRAGLPLRLVGLVVLVGVGVNAGAAKQTGDQTVGATLAQAVEAGRNAYGSGRWADALAAFERAAALDPRAAVPRYDIAATLFQMERYAEAADAYALARAGAGAALRMKTDYGLGNTALALGDVPSAIAHFDACLASQAPGADLDSVRRDAAANRRFAVESAQRNPAPPSSERGSPTARRPRPPQSDHEDPSPREAHAPGQTGGADGAGQGTQGRRGKGGAGGSGAAPPDTGSPEDRLDSALERVRESRHHRLAESAPPDPSRTDRKEW